jgi:hypothetical protein
VLGDIDVSIVMMDSPIEPSSTHFKQKKLAAAYDNPW